MTQWSPQQAKALEKVGEWLKEVKNKNNRKGDWRQIFRLMGYAGTGKTTLAKHLAQDINRVFFMAYTGKAAHVLRKKGCVGATTIHQSIYEIDLEAEELTFRLNEFAFCRNADLIIVDEVSMVNEEIGRDLMSFNVPILVLGDPAQLPPVKGTGFFINGQPDVLLTEVHRQAEDNPIIRLASMVRTHRMPPRGKYGESEIVRTADDSVFMEADQILVGKNVTRQNYNSHARRLLGLASPHNLPVVGDRLICLRNNHQVGLLNGAMYKAEVVRYGLDEEDDLIEIDPNYPPYSIGLTIRPEGEDRVVKVEAYTHGFLGKDLPEYGDPTTVYMDYGYAITVHKSQGSEWDKVAIVDESWAFREQRWKWLYTAITRASKRLVLVTRG